MRHMRKETKKNPELRFPALGKTLLMSQSWSSSNPYHVRKITYIQVAQHTLQRNSRSFEVFMPYTTGHCCHSERPCTSRDGLPETSWSSTVINAKSCTWESKSSNICRWGPDDLGAALRKSTWESWWILNWTQIRNTLLQQWRLTAHWPALATVYPAAQEKWLFSPYSPLIWALWSTVSSSHTSVQDRSQQTGASQQEGFWDD